jgi:hypothetical protein
MKIRNRLLLLVARRKLRKLKHLTESAERFTGSDRQGLSQFCPSYYAMVREMDSAQAEVDALLHL